MTDLTNEQLDRYNRQLIIDGFGSSAQKKLLKSSILIIGLGGLGSPAAMYLAAAGVGTLGLVDDDHVSRSNLPRQLLYSDSVLGKSKVDIATKHLLQLNSSLNIHKYAERLSLDNAREILNGYDFVIEATDNFESKFLINDSCVDENIPFSHGGVLDWSGQLMTVIPKASACYRCVFKETPETDVSEKRSGAGIVGPVPGVIGSLQAIEAIKYLTNVRDLLTNCILQFDSKTMQFRNTKVSPQKDCKACRS